MSYTQKNYVASSIRSYIEIKILQEIPRNLLCCFMKVNADHYHLL